ncbi:MAG: winged helix-turn-helix domain-containing protein [Cellulosilyticaceae bacterium]
MDSKYLMYLANADLKATEYKILLMLLTRPYTAAQIVQALGIMKGNTNRYMKNLENKGLIELDRVEGSNKFYRAVTDMKNLIEVMPGQTKLT